MAFFVCLFNFIESNIFQDDVIIPIGIGAQIVIHDFITVKSLDFSNQVYF